MTKETARLQKIDTLKSMLSADNQNKNKCHLRQNIQNPMLHLDFCTFNPSLLQKMDKFVIFIWLKISIFVITMLYINNSGAAVSFTSQIHPENFRHSVNESISMKNKGHILFFHHAGTTSHINVLKSLAGGLLEKGHKVTTAFYGKTQITHDNYTEIVLPNR